ncbi:hypothetical protein JOF48_002889 [Arthrobacter stackebrandtii]|uniref:Uncharacterized protein n=1 Tax=Arthrobacter stackebrandtii TaxID=272161 RepID=A0ABS4YZW2_9MICC|nr:hypothetical protein [Arthrobacter stackebrandtii]MBP2414090.1 hypothetical protein [Arthrobacter stackebrandtii]
MRNYGTGREYGRTARYESYRHRLLAEAEGTGRLSAVDQRAAEGDQELITKHLMTGEYDVLLDDGQLEQWPAALGRLSEAVSEEIFYQGKIDGRVLRRQVGLQLQLKFGLRPHADLGSRDYLRFRDYIQACGELGDLGWWRDHRAANVGKAMAVFRSERGSRTLSLHWKLQHMHATFLVGGRGVPSRAVLFTLSTQGALVAVDGPLPDGFALSRNEWDALGRILVAMVGLQTDFQQQAYQMAMDKSH